MKKRQKLLEKLRKSLNLSQNEIASRLGVSRPTYVLIENDNKELTLSQAKLLSDLYNVPVDAIRTGYLEEKHTSENDIVITQLPTKQGVFSFGVWNQKKGEEIIFLQTPNLDVKKPVLVRVHSECITGDVFHSYRCDCGEQKDRSLSMISESGNGVFIYLRQEGRGIGLFEKIKAYILQDKGYDTHEANILLGHKPDYREYSWVKKVLDNLGVKEIRLITNNPSKVAEISRLGIKVIERVPVVIESNHYNRRYFETKRQKFKHFFGKDESNYFYQFSYVESPEQVAEIGEFMANSHKDPFLKICMGVYADTHILNDSQELKKIEAIFKSADHYEGFVPILHFTFKFSVDPLKDIANIREKMPFVKYIQLNDLATDHLKVLKYANKFFLVDIPLSDKDFGLIDDNDFVEEITKYKAFVLLDNSHGTGKQDSKANVVKKINKLLSKGVNDIAIYGGFGPNSMSLYFDLKEHYKINFSIDAETKLKTNDSLDLKKVKEYLSELMSHKYEYKS
ncbi:MAG: GTP cyclohydrolase II [Minisyncoccia bacterium]